jgi:hypothetical protein
MIFTVKTIGRSVRLPYWTSCVVIVEDIGLLTFWGHLLDVKTGERIAMPEGKFVGNLSEPWEIVLEARDLIDAL